MSNILSKLIDCVKLYQKELFLVACLILISIISYNIGQINALKKIPISVTSGQANISQTATKTLKPAVTPILDKRVVASKNSDKYHFTWCSGAKRIKEENKIWFESAQEAESRGYALAGNCY